MSSGWSKRFGRVGVLGLAAVAGVVPVAAAQAQTPTTQPAAPDKDEITRKVKSKVSPVYPDIARRMNISGTVKVLVVVSPSGVVKTTKVVGGHPLLVGAAMDALKKWKFEAASDESTGTVEFKFQPQN